MRGGPGSSALRHANPDGPPLPPSALSTAPSRTSGERAQALQGGVGLVAYLVTRRQALFLLVGVLPHRWVLEGCFYIIIMDLM